MPTCKPLRLMQATIELPFRHFDCRFYQKCLDAASAGYWQSWCCTGCHAFEAAAPATVSNNQGRDF